VTGLLVPRGDGPALGHALARLAGDDALAKALGRAAHEHVARRFSLARMAEAYERVFAL
jgi:glycosyltransferase involved in cell wall biosynthesis